MKANGAQSGQLGRDGRQMVVSGLGRDGKQGVLVQWVQLHVGRVKNPEIDGGVKMQL
jgi:hypothetical protein